MEVLRYSLKEYMRWYRRNFLPVKQYAVFLKAEGDKTCIYFSYDLTDEIDGCIRKCKKSRNYDDCFMECYENVTDAAEEFLAEQSYAFEKLLEKKGIKYTCCDWDWSSNDVKTLRWVRLCLP